MVNRKMHKLLLLFFLGVMTPCLGNVVDNGMKQLSWHDRACMKIFFDEAIKMDQIGHVLFYNHKPACLIALILKDKHKTFRNIQCMKGWQAFKKYEPFFPHPNFHFNENIVEFDDNFKVLHIYIINKQSLINTLENHIDLFREFFGKDFVPEWFLAKLEEGYSLPNLLKENEVLLGVLLGYGLESAKAFYEANANHTRDYAPPETESYCAIELKQPRGCKIYPVVFLGNPCSSEVQELGAVYEKELEEIWKVYKSSNNRLKIVLKGLCSEK